MTGGEEKKNIYRTIVKATGLFGGTQVFTILCSIIKTKLVAIWLGAEGVGIIGLYNNTVEMISSLTRLGIGTSSVRDLSKAFKSGDESRFAELVSVVRRWIWFTGLLGAVVMLTFAPLLSRYTFGDDAHIWGYVFLSCTLLFTTLTEGERAVIQASERLRVLARCSVLGSFFALLLSLPLFYFFGISGIVPAIIAHTFSIWVVTVSLGRKMKVKPVKMSWTETYRQGKNIASLGIYMTVIGLSAFGVSGMAVLPCLMFFRGFGTCMLAGFLYRNYSLQGIAFADLIILPSCLVADFLLLYASGKAMELSKRFFDCLRDVSARGVILKPQCVDLLKKILRCTLIFVVVSLAESAFTVCFIKYFNFA